MKPTAKIVAWEMLDDAIRAADKRKPIKFSYPKGSLEEAMQQAVKQLGGTDENGLGKGRRK